MVFIWGLYLLFIVGLFPLLFYISLIIYPWSEKLKMWSVNTFPSFDENLWDVPIFILSLVGWWYTVKYGILLSHILFPEFHDLPN